ncbi:C-reactive protein-like [Eublepharis macularius]|uniref:Pentraxin family member n=1 Tax=Eublepharis macularius TaxID=481883 RepID=A0AA97L8S7_EUBMA|nr:C-reactive protein-like [Eublepharis macularius]
MRKRLLSFLLLAGLWGSLAQEDLERKAFVFPEASKTAYVVLETTLKQPLTGFTLCMRFYTELTRGYSLFSYASRRSANEILLFAEKPNQYSFTLGDRAVIFNVPEKMNTNPFGRQICASWESATGLVELWVNGQPMVRKSLKKGHSVSTEASIILGQEQDSFGGRFEITQSFVGEILDLYMWDRVLSPDEVGWAWFNGDVPGNVINWKSLSYKSHGEVFVKPALSSFYRAVGG